MVYPATLKLISVPLDFSSYSQKSGHFSNVGHMSLALLTRDIGPALLRAASPCIFKWQPDNKQLTHLVVVTGSKTVNDIHALTGAE
jgi:hypothetical protein